MTTTKSYAALSDCHGYLPDPLSIPEVDFLFLGGDLWPATNHSLPFQYEWAKGTLGPWLEQVNKRVGSVVGISGNHDFVGTSPYGKSLLKSLPWTYLQDETVTFGGIKIHGSPWTPTFLDWAWMDSDWQLMQYWNRIPSNGLDVLMVHGPPHGVLDQIQSGEHVGSESLKARLEQISPPQVSLYGHIHGARGVHGGMYGVPLSVNASTVNEGYEPVHAPFVGELVVRP